MCQGGSVTQESVLLDFFYAHDAGIVRCKCNVLIVAGKQFTFSEISSPGYNGCGSEITISRDNSQNGDTHRISCLGGTTYSELISGETLTVELYKRMAPMDTRYCYRLDIRNAPHPSMTVTCTEETTTTSTTTTTMPTTTTLPLTTPTSPQETTKDTTEAITTEMTTKATTATKTTSKISTTVSSTMETTAKSTTIKSNSGGLVSTPQCPAESDLLIGSLGALTGVTLLYSVIITVLYFRRKTSPPPQPQNPYAEVYEEIPAYVSPVRSSNSQNRALPKIPTVSGNKKPPKPPSSKIPSSHHQNQYQSEGSFIRHINGNNSSHWNWTYNEKTEQERERERTEYLMAF